MGQSGTCHKVMRMFQLAMKWVKIGIEWRAWNGVVTYLEAFYEVIRMDGFQRGWDLWDGQTDDWPSVF